VAVLTQTITEEVWADVPGYEGEYQVSSLGRVRSLLRRRWNGRGWRNVPGRLLGLKPGRYPAVSLCRTREDQRTVNVHTLVLTAFVGPPPPGMECCHEDGDKWNCRLSNLRWDTPTGNHRDRVRHGVSNRGERSGSAKLTREQVTVIRAQSAAGVPRRELATAFGVSPSLVSMIATGKRWI
jgi:hypothetical protein